MTARVLFVSVNRSFDFADPSFSLAQLEPWVERAWCIGVAKAAACDRVVAVRAGTPLAAWRIRGAFPTDQTYEVAGTTRPRAGLSLGDPLPLLPAYGTVPALRHGVAVAELPIEPLPVERQAHLTPDTFMSPEHGGPIPHAHPAYAYRLPEYVMAREAIDNLVQALNKRAPATATMSHAAWVSMVSDFARTNPYADCCGDCRAGSDLAPRYPHAVTIDDDGWLTGTYFCSKCGHQWTCGYAVDAPLNI